jgi:ubiquinone/menaquinone biosynthesis C-methylase UbiE
VSAEEPDRVIGSAMRSYYDSRAGEYDDWWLGVGKFTSQDRPGWADEVVELFGVLEALPAARVLDVACGSGWLTQHLRGEVTALDQSPAMVEVASARMPEAEVVQGEAVPLPFPDDSFERVTTGHFYGHLLQVEREPFLAEALRVAPELVVVDSGGGAYEGWDERVLDDGTRHEVYKRRFSGAGLAAELGGGEVLYDGRWFVVVRTQR